jgi:hypothetical protein
LLLQLAQVRAGALHRLRLPSFCKLLIIFRFLLHDGFNKSQQSAALFEVISGRM